MRRRQFIAALGTAAMWPLSARAQQQAGPTRRIAALWPFSETDPDGRAELGAFRLGLRELGWGNIVIESRWGGGNLERTRDFAAELVRLAPDVIFARANAQLGPLSRETRTIPIVFVGASDPVGAGYVASLARPRGNITGFTLYEPALAGKWLGVLKEVLPGLRRVALLINPETAILRGTFYTQALNTAASAIGVDPVVSKVFNASDIEAAIHSLAKKSDSGLIVAPDTFSDVNGDLIISLAAQYRLPTVYAISRFVKRGGLMSYGPNERDAVKRATTYVDRILKGEKPSDLPVQAPVKFDLVVNLKTAKALGLSIAESFLLRADEVIE
ncbi:MAG: ABC transporter substrate-binding protein [Bradyrhizobium sp.]|nr:ABC transporter substrate-binding protein [Bradyrhizobium sp.]